ncbi:putative mRNA splicing protein [Nadsonia fulvescens var. elongata DSM 6958]|uniref:Pre-mRNA-splicing factor PRP46 n=1 Tax=Nadsonia fulvescens var. elongata DSM 6958 TaxID=857566 RepID=A0A1E3PD03_9ASCO|nr:putative mRNA splicing protein [Nadsonia fulvescens var. elongata DSM 6958]
MSVSETDELEYIQSTILSSRKRTRALFGPSIEDFTCSDEPSHRLKLLSKVRGDYASAAELPLYLVNKITAASAAQTKRNGRGARSSLITTTQRHKLLEGGSTSTNITLRSKPNPMNSASTTALTGLIDRPSLAEERPEWHAPWEVMRVITGHLGWVRSVCVEPDNQWFATGSTDRTIKIWDLASGTLKLSLTGHIMGIRGLAVSPRHPYLFSGGEDKLVKCWDLEQNKVIRSYHGHLSAINAVAVHPTLDLLVTAGRDAAVRVWDIRTKTPVFTLTGHKSTIFDLKCQEADPQIISSSEDATIRLWDLAAGKTQTVLTHHKKSVRALAVHPNEFTFASASPDNIKKWRCPNGDFINNFYPNHNAIINTLAVNADGVMFSGGDNGSIGFFDWKSGHKFQETASIPIPGSLEAENGIFCSTFDQTGLRLITGEADKSIKIWKEKPDATRDSDPGIEWKPSLTRQRF